MDVRSTLLSEEFAEEIVTTASEAVGETLRSVTYFTRNDFDQLYLRDDLERDADLSTFVGHEWRGFKNTQNAYQQSELGEYRFTIRAFTNGYLVRVTHDRAGVLVTTDDKNLDRFESLTDAIEDLLAGHEHAR